MMALNILSKQKRIPKGQSKLEIPEKLETQVTQGEEKQNKNNPEKLATQGTQGEEKQNKNTTQYVCTYSKRLLASKYQIPES